ncbi:hypothetical protein M413DRAFT_236865 [Hebeloma cylindrosporum]|uniref:Uncharacterized protein n=1 Tax=Hebeloma cylindrosporum TaxID=76867 RepID=A0A0C3C6F3_HEBCY|nr:hypothetical protein M413DRAFT_236865 [Hebeloma cylindrosporum h7]
MSVPDSINLPEVVPKKGGGKGGSGGQGISKVIKSGKKKTVRVKKGNGRHKKDERIRENNHNRPRISNIKKKRFKRRLSKKETTKRIDA